MLPSQVVLAKLSRRIEQAYGLRRPDWRGGCSTPRLWSAAAVRLWSTHAADPTGIPLDAELFVASQPHFGSICGSLVRIDAAGLRPPLPVAACVRSSGGCEPN